MRNHVNLRNAIFAEGITATEEQVANILKRIAQYKDKEKTNDDCHGWYWYCGCGHWNGSNLAICAMCGRTPGGI